MALLFANHTATVFDVTETPDPSSKEIVLGEAGGETISCQIRPMKDGTVVLDERTAAELTNPHEMKLEPEDAGVPKYGARVLWHETQQQFRITSRINRHEAGGELADLDHGSVQMELLEVVDE